MELKTATGRLSPRQVIVFDELGEQGFPVHVLHSKDDVEDFINGVCKSSTTSVPEGSYIQGAVGAELGSVSTPWTWEDSDDTDDHSGAVRGEDADHCSKKGSGNSLVSGSTEVEPSQAPTRIEDHGQSDAEIVRLEFGRRYLSNKP